MKRIDRLYVHTPSACSGQLEHTGRHVFAYDPALLATPSAAISLTMPMRLASYEHTLMLPALQTFMPEGFIAERLRERFGKTFKMNDMALLALSSGDAIGRLRVSVARDAPTTSATIALRELLADQGNRALFDDLCERFLFSSAIAGVQPKVLVTATNELAVKKTSGKNKMSLEARAAIKTAQYIVKAGETSLPNLAANEFHCLSIARDAGLDVPEFWLSEDEKRLIVARFDRIDNAVLGFEDMVSLQGKQNADKYDGSYESVAKAITLNASPAHLASSLKALFEIVTLSVLLRNGDAHLKNFGLLYTDPTTDDCRLAPTYDIVTTTTYLANDRMALSLARDRTWPTDGALIKFGREHCRVNAPRKTIDRIRQAISDYRPSQAKNVWKQQRVLVVQSDNIIRKNSPKLPSEKQL
jgi:serine/threonine-protein kinase HipA